jgi:hypothetical protein
MTILLCSKGAAGARSAARHVANRHVDSGDLGDLATVDIS